jgi:hypothetical protein
MIMKGFIFLVSICFCYAGLHAQSRLVTTQYQKSMQPAVEVEVPYAEKTVSNSLIERFENRGYKSKESKGYLIFKGVKLSDLGPDEYDLYFKVDQKSRKEKETSIITMLISSGYEKFIGESDNPELYDNAKKFLNQQTSITAAHDLELQIQEQDEVIKKEDKKLTSLMTDSVNLQKKKTKLDLDIEENSKKQELQKAEIEKQKLIYEKLAARRKQ